MPKRRRNNYRVTNPNRPDTRPWANTYPGLYRDTYYPEEIIYPGYGERDEAKATTQTLMLVGGLAAAVAIVFYLGSLQAPAA